MYRKLPDAQVRNGKDIARRRISTIGDVFVTRDDLFLRQRTRGAYWRQAGRRRTSMASIAIARRSQTGGAAELPAPRHFTVDEFYCMAKAGIFCEDDRVELVEGEIIRNPRTCCC